MSSLNSFQLMLLNTAQIFSQWQNLTNKKTKSNEEVSKLKSWAMKPREKSWVQLEITKFEESCWQVNATVVGTLCALWVYKAEVCGADAVALIFKSYKGTVWVQLWYDQITHLRALNINLRF